MIDGVDCGFVNSQVTIAIAIAPATDPADFLLTIRQPASLVFMAQLFKWATNSGWPL